MKEVKFKYDIPDGDRRHFVDEKDIKVLLSRLPAELWKNLRGVYFKDCARGRRVAGYVTGGRREINLCAFPPRMSLTSYLRRSQSPSMFGAIRGSQWPSLAIRRFMLYDVFLHELGHLQPANQKAESTRRKYKGETMAQDFAEFWCEKLWAKSFDHADPVHNPPSKGELDKLNKYWKDAHLEYKRGLRYEEQDKRELALIKYSRAIQLFDAHALALEALGVFNYDTVKSPARASGFLNRALKHDPTLHDANMFMGLSLSNNMHQETESRKYFDKAIKLASEPGGTLSVYARVVAKWGYFEEAKKLFKRAIKKNPQSPFIMHNYKMFLLDDKNPEKELNLREKASILREKDLRITSDIISRYSRGLQVIYWYDLKKNDNN